MDRPTRLLQTLVSSAKNLKGNPWLVPLFLLPLCLVLWTLHRKNECLSEAAEKVDIMEQKASSAERLLDKQQQVWSAAQKSNPQYLSSVVEALPLLAPELHRVQALARQSPENTSLQERLSFLQGDSNRIRFIQQAERSGKFFQETELKMQNTVQMNEDDLKKFLSAIEIDQDRPLLIIKEFELKKQKEKADETVYNIKAEIIKRAP